LQEICDGFFQSGLFRFSRHPNYFAEQSMWVCVYLFVPVALRSEPAFVAATAALQALGVPPALAKLVHLPSILGT
jgi:steroid 5-alpha reductase family enzyme